jgi:hypothetical protein
LISALALLILLRIHLYILDTAHNPNHLALNLNMMDEVPSAMKIRAVIEGIVQDA